MYKRILLGSFALTLLMAAGLPIRAQTTERSPATQETEQAPATRDSQQAPATQDSQQAPATQGQEAPQSSQVSQEDLQKFANAIKQIQTIQKDYQGRMVQAVEGEGLSQERFMEIQQSQSNPSAQPSTQISNEEKQSFEQANAKVSQLQQEAESKMKEAVQAQGLDIQRFNEIFAAIQQDPSLQQQVQQMIQQ
ncbi:hypothetical protein NIES593_12120 [Hydrococcus rivularis NIES-593]|uniref:DUF4168 domain-containing protein n=1 Tax=Hydrococcus rivularis NIES-593 TaxID=1921803 RepID=A0A1U7HG29_9CYAN|nr:DUF4168 domain-containing protein [Hydrococcus rivularis]OKH22537.1 hypothetical protein NIES593_12120 [Hydrococcus rivularis NIES-593]